MEMIKELDILKQITVTRILVYKKSEQSMVCENKSVRNKMWYNC